MLSGLGRSLTASLDKATPHRDSVQGFLALLVRGWASNAGPNKGTLETQQELDVSQEQPADLSRLVLEEPSTSLRTQHTGCYYPVNHQRFPEAFQDFHQLFYGPRKRPRQGGCIGLQEEFAASRSQHLMYRQSMHNLFLALTLDVQQPLGGREGKPMTHFLVDGPVGAGKSIALAALVERMRSHGWLVMYIPSARALVEGGFFKKRPEVHLWDTVISAQHVLKSVGDSHSSDLGQLPIRSQSVLGMLGTRQGTLQDLVVRGVAAEEEAQLAVDCCLALRDELFVLAEERQVLFVVDDYNYLFWRTGYGTMLPGGGRRELKVEELSLATGMMLLGQDTGQAKVLCATCHSGSVPSYVEVTGKYKRYMMPRYNDVEVAHALSYYHRQGLLAEMPSEEMVYRMLALTNGNGDELRRLVAASSHITMPIRYRRRRL